jgi:hypothetical protein
MLNKIDEESLNNCSICLLSLINDIKKLSCNHSFHENCITDWLKLKTSCPLCRSLISIPMENLTSLNITIIQTNNNHNNHNNYYKLFMYSYYIFILFNFCSTCYLDVNITQINNHIIDIILNNETMINLVSETKNNNAGFLFFFDIIYMIIYLFGNIYININLFCGLITVFFSYVINITIHRIFISDGFNKLDNNIYNFDESYKKNFILSIILYSTSFTIITIYIFIYAFKKF